MVSQGLGRREDLSERSVHCVDHVHVIYVEVIAPVISRDS